MSKAEKTLVILTPGFPENDADTSCLPLQQQLVKALRESNLKINIIVLSFQYPFRTEEYSWFNTEIIPFNGQDKGGLHRLLLRKRIIKTLKQIHETTPISGLLSFWYGECAAVGKIFADKNGLKHFCWILGQDAKKENKYPRKNRLRSNELIALSDFLRSEFVTNHGVKPDCLVPAGINPRLYSPKLQEKNIDILGAGSLIPLKRYDIFIDIVKTVKEKLPTLKVVLAGDGPEKERLKQLISESGLTTTIKLTGRLPYTEVLSLMQKSKVFLHPSSYEGFSGVCAEALYAGSHVISFCKAMNDEIEHWHIVSSKEDMIQKILSLLESPSTIYKQVLFCSIDDVVKKMIPLFFENS